VSGFLEISRAAVAATKGDAEIAISEIDRTGFRAF